jgi:hypothetical protein
VGRIVSVSRVLVLGAFVAALGAPLAGRALAATGPASAGRAAPAIVLRAERIAHVLDDDGVAVDMRDTPYTAPDPGSPDSIRRIPFVASRLAAHLDRQQGDARGWVALARLVRLRQIFSHMDPGLSPASVTRGDPRDTVQALLGRALRADSTWADAHFWAGVLRREPILNLPAEPDTSDLRRLVPDYEGALTGFARAHELRPTEPRYRASYVNALTGVGRLLEAERIEQEGIADVSQRRFAVARLLRDWESVPMPPGCQETPAASLIAARGMHARHTEDPSSVASAVRWRQVVCTMPADSVVAFFQSVWPGISFQKSEEASNPFLPVDATYGVVLRWDAQSLTPIDPAAVESETRNVLNLIVMRLAPPAGAPSSLETGASHGCLIWCMNDRVLEP